MIGAAVWWQWAPIVREARKVCERPVHRGGLLRAAHRLPEDARPGPIRVEVPNLRSQWETYYVAKEFPLARGWLRQLDVELNPLFYEDYDDGQDVDFNATTYRAWLPRTPSRTWRCADAPLGYAGDDEGELIESGGADGYLRPAFRSEHWTVYEVTAPHPMTVNDDGADIRATSIELESVGLDVRQPGSAIVRVHFSPYWRLDGGCVERAGDWTRVTTENRGPLTLRMDFSAGRVLDRGRRCG